MSHMIQKFSDQPQPKPAQDGKPQGSNKKGGRFFSRFANQTARLSGTPITFSVAVGIILVWAITGPLFKFSDTWQLVINTGTTIVTFLMVFLIQNTQNRDSEALHLKIDELIRANKRARNAMIDLEDLTQAELDAFKEKFTALARQGRDINQDCLEDLVEEARDEARQQTQSRQSKADTSPDVQPELLVTG